VRAARGEPVTLSQIAAAKILVKVI
jgi:hypothetical protein